MLALTDTEGGRADEMNIFTHGLTSPSLMRMYQTSQIILRAEKLIPDRNADP